MKCEWCLHSEGGHWPDCPEPRFDAVCSERDELRSQIHRERELADKLAEALKRVGNCSMNACDLCKQLAGAALTQHAAMRSGK